MADESRVRKMEMEWGVLGAKGDIVLFDVPNEGDRLELRRARIGDLKVLGLMLEDADAKTTAMDEALQIEVGMTGEQQRISAILQAGSEGEQLKGEDLIQIAAVDRIQRRYIEGIQRYILSDENPYPVVFQALMERMGGLRVEIDDMPQYMLAQGPISAVLGHMQNAPLIPGPQPTRAAPATTPGRKARRPTASGTTQ